MKQSDPPCINVNNQRARWIRVDQSHLRSVSTRVTSNTVKGAGSFCCRVQPRPRSIDWEKPTPRQNVKYIRPHGLKPTPAYRSLSRNARHAMNMAVEDCLCASGTNFAQGSPHPSQQRWIRHPTRSAHSSEHLRFDVSEQNRIM